MDNVLLAHHWASQLVQDHLDPASRLELAHASKACMRAVASPHAQGPYRCSLYLQPASRLGIVDALAAQVDMQQLSLHCGNEAVPPTLASRVTHLTVMLSNLERSKDLLPWHAFTQLEELEVRHSWSSELDSDSSSDSGSVSGSHSDSMTAPPRNGVISLGTALQHAAEGGQVLLPQLRAFTYTQEDMDVRDKADDRSRAAYRAAVNSLLAQLGPRVPCVHLQLGLWEELLDLGLLTGATSLRLQAYPCYYIQASVMAAAFRLSSLQQLHVERHYSDLGTYDLSGVLPAPKRLRELIIDSLEVHHLRLLPMDSVDILVASCVRADSHWPQEEDMQLLALHQQRIRLQPPLTAGLGGMNEVMAACVITDAWWGDGEEPRPRRAALVQLVQQVRGPALWLDSDDDGTIQQALAALQPTVSCMHFEVRDCHQHLEVNARALPPHVQHVVLRKRFWKWGPDSEKLEHMLNAVSTILEHAPSSVVHVTWLGSCSDWVASAFQHRVRVHEARARVDLV